MKNKWRAAIRIDGKDLHIGYYKKEKEAAADYAREYSNIGGNWPKAKAGDSLSIETPVVKQEEFL